MAVATPVPELFDVLTPKQREFLLREIITRSYDPDRRATVWVYVHGYLADRAVEQLVGEAV